MYSIFDPPKEKRGEEFDRWCFEMFDLHRYSIYLIAQSARASSEAVYAAIKREERRRRGAERE